MNVEQKIIERMYFTNEIVSNINQFMSAFLNAPEATGLAYKEQLSINKLGPRYGVITLNNKSDDLDQESLAIEIFESGKAILTTSTIRGVKDLELEQTEVPFKTDNDPRDVSAQIILSTQELDDNPVTTSLYRYMKRTLLGQKINVQPRNDSI